MLDLFTLKSGTVFSLNGSSGTLCVGECFGVADPDPDLSSTIRVLAADMASEKMPIPTEYGYHDLVSWQQGDTTSNRPPRVGLDLGPAISKP